MKQHKFAVDGYAVGDRLLEGVMFNCIAVENDGKYELTDLVIDPDSADYFSDLNEKKWITEMREYVQDRLDEEPDVVIAGE